MIFGQLSLTETALHTHNDSYVLANVTAVSARRPFLSAGWAIAGLSVCFGIAFYDLLYLGELIGLGAMSILAWLGGCRIGQLRLVSRDLRGSPIADAVYGTYGHLNRFRPLIADAVERASSGGPS